MEVRNMFRLVPLLVCAGTALAAPPLTTIQDILYKADGTRFNGSLTIQWKSFQASDSSYIATQNVNLQVVDGVLRTKLVPTVGASPGANYQVTYQSSGKFLFSEIWAVPPATQTLKVRDVRVSSGTVVGPTTPIFGQLTQIGDIPGLEQELLLRPMRGPAFGIGRTAVLNAAGQIEAAQGNLSDCVRVDGSSGPCGAGGIGGTLQVFIDQEVPGGIVNGANATFVLAQTPSPASGLQLFRNGLLMRQNLDFTLSGTTITFFAASVPQVGDNLLASYRTVGSPSGGSVPRPVEVLCSGTGLTTPSTAMTTLATCTIAANTLAPGDQVQLQFSYSKAGIATSAMVTEVRWGATTVHNRTFTVSETAAAGDVELSATNAPSFFFAKSTALQVGLQGSTGEAAEALTSPIVVSFLGSLNAGSPGNSITLRSFRVVRFPSVTAP